MRLAWYVVLFASLLVARLLYVVVKHFASPLRKFPGPTLGRFTKLWYLNRVRQGRFHLENIDLHRKHGPVVRLAPDWYSINVPDKAVYGAGSKFTKSDWYQGWKHPSPERWTLFTDQDLKRHSESRRIFQTMYSMSSMVSYEKFVDDCEVIFSRRLSEFSKTGEVVDMGHWFQCLAFDVIGNISYSQRFGFLDRGDDIAGIIAALDRSMKYSALSGIYSGLHPVTYKLMETSSHSGAAGRNYVAEFARRIIASRQEQRKTSPAQERSDSDQELPRDFLDKLLDGHAASPEKVTPYHIWMAGFSNIGAGSDTTAASLSGILYHLLKTPQALQRLRREIEEFEANGALGKTRVSFKESQSMPYLQAVIKEGLRMHPATGLPLWRRSPAGGATIAGHYFPAGTVVGLNCWVAHFDEGIFGSDAKTFRPERWLEAKLEGEDKVKQMEGYYMPVSSACHPRSPIAFVNVVGSLAWERDHALESTSPSWKSQNYCLKSFEISTLSWSTRPSSGPR